MECLKCKKGNLKQKDSLLYQCDRCEKVTPVIDLNKLYAI